MDPISLVSSIVGTAAFGFKILVILRELVEGVKSAPEELKLLTLEVEDLCHVMDNFRKEAKGQISDQGIERSSRAIMDTFARLKQLLTEYAVCEEDGLLKKGWKQIKWHCIEKDITKLREHLNSNKSNLLVALALANELRHGCSDAGQGRVRGSPGEYIGRLQAPSMSTVAQIFILRRREGYSSKIALSSHPTAPDGQVSAARSESGILSEEGFPEQSIPVSAHQFKDMGARGIGVLTPDVTQTGACAVGASAQEEVSYSKPSEAGAPRAESSASSPKPATRSSKLTPPVGPEPGEGDGVHGGEDNSKPKEAAASGSFTEIPSGKERLKPRGLFRSARHRLENFRKPRSKAKELEGGEAVHKLRDASLAVALNAPPLRVLACEPVTRESHRFAMERLLRVLKVSSSLTPGNLFGGLGGIQKPLKGKTYATCNLIVPVSLSQGMYSHMTRSSWKQPTREHYQKMIPSSSKPTDVPY
jgi:hypothetical protein